jgi:hypothetical protein
MCLTRALRKASPASHDLHPIPAGFPGLSGSDEILRGAFVEIVVYNAPGFSDGTEGKYLL